MPYPFILPTTSAFFFSLSYSCESHPSLLLSASTHRGVVRETLKKHKRLPPSSQAPSLSSVVSSLNSYLPYLLAVDAALNKRPIHGQEINAEPKTAPAIEWRPVLSDTTVPGKESARVRVASLDYEIFFALATLANTYSLQARATLHPLYVTSSAPVGTQQRQAAITSATKSLLEAASIYDYLTARAETLTTGPPCSEVSPAAVRGQASLARAEATLLAVLKDDPYPAVVAQDRNENDTEWMYKAPDIPKLRVHLFARLCLAAAEHAAQAHSLCAGRTGGNAKLSEGFVRYLEDLRRTSRAKACRFFGVNAEMGGQTGEAIAWLHAGLQELGVEKKEAKKGLGFGKLKRDWSEKREDRKVERGTDWGADAGKWEETRVMETLEAKWTKQNDTIFTQVIPPTGPLLAQMPSGREIHTVAPFQPPILDASTLEAMLAPPDRSDEAGNYPSSDDETLTSTSAVGAFPGTQSEYRTGTPSYF